MATTPAGIYPLSTQDGKDIPFDIVRPLLLLFYDLVKDTDKAITIPTNVQLVFVYSRVDCLIRFENVVLGAIVQNTVYTNTIFVPAGIPVSVVATPGAGYIRGFASGRIFLSFVEQWASLSQPLQATIG